MTARERLEAAKAARLALAEARKPSEDELLEAAANAEELALRNEEAIAAAEDKHGKKNLAIVKTDQEVVIVKRLDSVLFNRFQDELAKAEALSSDKVVEVVYKCIVSPDKPRFGAMLSEQPLLAQRCLAAIADLAGAKRVELGGKY